MVGLHGVSAEQWQEIIASTPERAVGPYRQFTRLGGVRRWSKEFVEASRKRLAGRQEASDVALVKAGHER